jgi:hypothetical protein
MNQPSVSRPSGARTPVTWTAAHGGIHSKILRMIGSPLPLAPGSYRATSSSETGWITKQNFGSASLTISRPRI